MTQNDFYQVLGIEKDASDDEIKKKYYALAKKFHPDKNQDQEAEEKFKEINTAYEALKDADSRRTYAMQKRGEEMEKRFSNQASNFTFFSSPFGPSTRSSFGMGFSAHDLHDIFGKAFRGRNKENAKPRAPDQSGFNNGTYRDPNISFTFSFFEEPQGPTRSRFEEPEGIFDNFFHDPFFMDSWPFSDGGLHSSGANRSSHRETRQQPSQTSSSSHRPKQKAPGPSSSKPPPSSKPSSSRPPSAKASSARPQKDSRKKGDEEKLYDWQENLFGSSKKAKEEPKTESTSTEEVPDDVKLTCNYCCKKFYPEALSIHEPLCQEKYYGRGPSSKPTSSSVPKSESTSKSDILKEAYGQARKEFMDKYISPPKPPSPPPDFLLCEWCGQSFSDGVAKYHIPFCGRKHAAEQKEKEKKKPDSNNNQAKPPRGSPGASSRGTSETRRPTRDYKRESAADDPLLRSTYRSSHVTPPRPPPSMSRATGSTGYDNVGSSRSHARQDGKALHEDIDDYLYGSTPRRSNPIGSSHGYVRPDAYSQYIGLGRRYVGSPIMQSEYPVLRDFYPRTDRASVGRADHIGISPTYGGGGSLGRAEFANAKAAKYRTDHPNAQKHSPRKNTWSYYTVLHEPFTFRPIPRATLVTGRPSGSTTRIRYVPAAANASRPTPLIQAHVSTGGSSGQTPSFTFRFGRAASGGTI